MNPSAMTPGEEIVEPQSTEEEECTRAIQETPADSQHRAEEPAAEAFDAAEGIEAVTRAVAEGCNAEGTATDEPQVTGARHGSAFCELAAFSMQTTSGHLASPQEIASRLIELGLSSEESEWFAGNIDLGLRASASSCQLDVMKYLVEECGADVDAGDEVRQHTDSNRLLVWFGG